MEWNDYTQFEKLEDGIYSFYTPILSKYLFQKIANKFYFFGFQTPMRSYSMVALGITNLQPLEGFGPENPEYRGKAGSGQSRETDLIEIFHCEGDYSQMDILKKINRIINKVNQSDKLVTITNGGPILTSTEIETLVTYINLNGCLKYEVTWKSILEKLERLKV